MTVLVAGGAGYIGSHTVVELLNVERKSLLLIIYPIVMKLSSIVLRESLVIGLIFIKADVCDFEMMERVFSQYDFDAVIHSADQRRSVKVLKPLLYYRNNLESTWVLVELMRKYNVPSFSSSATVWRNGTCADQRRYTVPLCESLWQNEDDQ